MAFREDTKAMIQPLPTPLFVTSQPHIPKHHIDILTAFIKNNSAAMALAITNRDDPATFEYPLIEGHRLPLPSLLGCRTFGEPTFLGDHTPRIDDIQHIGQSLMLYKYPRGIENTQVRERQLSLPEHAL